MTLPEKEFDAIVVGSGPGGATVARELAFKGKKVLILEWGTKEPITGSLMNMAPRGLVPMKSMLLTGQALGMVRGITTGGSSMFYCGTAFEPPVDMLKNYDVDITAEVEEIRNEVPMDTLCDELISPAGRVFHDSAEQLGYDVKQLHKFIYQTKCQPECSKCMYGCPYGAKWTSKNFVDEALENGARMVNHAKVSRVIIERGQAIGVEYKKGRQLFQAFADKIIVAAGGIGSPVILRKSGIQGVGKDFFFDPLIFVHGKIPGHKGGKGIPMSSGIHMPEEGIVMTDFNLPQMMKMAFDLEVFKVRDVFSFSNTVPIMIKIKDGLGGTVKDGEWIWKTLSKADKKKLDTGAAHAKRILENAGATRTYRSWVLAAHPGGTVKIGEHLDTNLKTKFDNLYVCDCSVIPEAWGLPPTFSLLALGKRLGKHLLQGAGTAKNAA